MVSHPGPPQIRARAINAHGSSFKRSLRCYPSLSCGHVHGFRCTRHVSLQRLFETASPSLRRVLRSSSPASSLLWDAPTPCRPSRRTSLPWFGDTVVSSPVRPHQLGTGAGDHLELVSRGSGRQSRRKRQGLSGSRATLMSLCPVLGPRQDRDTPGHRGASARPPLVSTTVAPTSKDFGARSHGIGTHCLRFAGRVTPPPRKTRFSRAGTGQALPGGIRSPAGLQ